MAEDKLEEDVACVDDQEKVSASLVNYLFDQVSLSIVDKLFGREGV